MHPDSGAQDNSLFCCTVTSPKLMSHVWRACNLTSFSPCLTGPLDYPFASCYKKPGFKTPGGTCVKPGFSW